MKRVLLFSVLLVLVMPVMVFSAGSSSSSGGQQQTATPSGPGGKLFNVPVTFEMWTNEHPSYPYIKGLFLERVLSEKYNVNLNVTAFPSGKDEKITLGLASGDLPDFTHGVSPSVTAPWAAQGALVPISDHFKNMPNYTAWAAKMGDYPNNFYNEVDGKLYIMPNYGHGDGNAQFWMYRKDIFDKHNLKVPNNENELYEAAKALKKLYPDSYPLTTRGWMGKLDNIAWQWGTGWQFYYKNDQQGWVLGPTEPQFKLLVQWLAKMYAENLIPPDTLSLTVNGWQEYILTNRAFISNDYIARISMLNTPMREKDPNVSWTYMKPFEANGSGIRTFNAQSMLFYECFCIFSTSKKIPDVIKYMDWFYSPEAIELTNYGIKNETFTVGPDGYRRIIGYDGSFYRERILGIRQRGFNIIADDGDLRAVISDPNTAEAYVGITKDAGAFRKVAGITWNEARRDQVLNLGLVELSNVVTEAIGKFITGQRPLSEYDAFLAEINKMGLPAILKLYNEQQQANFALKNNNK